MHMHIYLEARRDETRLTRTPAGPLSPGTPVNPRSPSGPWNTEKDALNIDFQSDLLFWQCLEFVNSWNEVYVNIIDFGAILVTEILIEVTNNNSHIGTLIISISLW